LTTRHADSHAGGEGKGNGEEVRKVRRSRGRKGGGKGREG